MTDKNITEGLIEKDSINTPDNQAPVQKLGSFEDPSSYLKEVSTFVNLEELYTIVDLKMQNVYNASKYPYLMVRKIQEPQLVKVYGAAYLVEIWMKANSATGPAKNIQFQMRTATQPQAMSIYKTLAALVLKEKERSLINVIEFPGEQGGYTKVHSLKDPFDSIGGATTIYIDADNLIIGCQNKLAIYLIPYIKDEKCDPQNLITLQGDTILDLNLFSAVKSHPMVSIVSNQGRTLSYQKIIIERRVKVSEVVKFDLVDEDDQYSVALIQAYETFAHTTRKGFMEIAKLGAGEKRIDIVNTASLKLEPEIAKSLAENGLVGGIKRVKMIQNYIYIEAKNQIFVILASQVEDLHSKATEHTGTFLSIQIEHGGFNPIIFSNFHLRDNSVCVIHKHILCVKNLQSKKWYICELAETPTDYEVSNPVGKVIISDYKDGQISEKGQLSVSPYYKDDDVIFMVNKAQGIIYKLSNGEQNIFVDNLSIEVKVLFLSMQNNELNFVIHNIKDKVASFFTQLTSNKLTFETLGIPYLQLQEVTNIVVAKADQSVIIYKDGSFAEYDPTKKRVTHLTKTSSAETFLKMTIIADRFIYATAKGGQTSCFDLTQLRNLAQASKSAVAVEVSLPNSFLKFIKFDLQSEKFAIMTTRLVLQIYPFVHQPRINFSTMLKDVLTYPLVKTEEDHVFALKNDFKIYKWSIFTGKLLSIDDKSSIFKGQEVFQVTQCQRLLLRRVEAEQTQATDSVYRVVELTSGNGIANVIERGTYTYSHNKTVIVKFNSDCTMMLEGYNKDMRLYERDQSGKTWKKLKEFKNISQYSHVSPNLMKFYCQDEKTILGTEGQKLFDVPQRVASNITDVVFTEENILTITSNNAVRELDITNGEFKELKCYLHRYPLPAVLRQYSRSEITVVPQEADILQGLGRLNDFYEYALRFRKQQNYKAIFSLTDDFERNTAYITFPFTYYHWQLLLQVANGSFNVQNLPPLVIYELLFCILPNGETLLHKCGSNFEVLSAVYESVLKDEIFKNPLPIIGTNISYVKSLEDVTPLDVAIKQNDVRSADLILTILKRLSFDSHYEETQKSLPQLFKLGLTSLTEYFDARLTNAEIVGINFKRTKLRDLDGCGFALSSTNMGECDLLKLNDELQDENENESPVTVLVLDMPNIHKFTEQGSILLDCLSSTDVLEIFQNKSIRAIIEFKWGLIKKYMVLYMFLPYFSTLLTFMYYSLSVFENYNNPLNTPEDKQFYSNLTQVCITILVVQALYLLAHECVQMKNKGISYLNSPWNYIDLLPLAFIGTSACFSWIDADPSNARPVNAMAAFFLWIKFLYFLRIFKGTGYLISMIVEVVADMKIFLSVFIITLAAFGHCFLILSLNNADAEGAFVLGFLDSINFTYRMALGDFDTDSFVGADLWLVWTMFLLATVFLLIVMLNLLIAIISDTYERVQGQANNIMYKSMAELIFENEYLLTSSTIEKFNRDAGTYLLIAIAEKDMGDNGGQAWEGKIHALKIAMNARHIEVTELLQRIGKDSQDYNGKMEDKFDKVEIKMTEVARDLSRLEGKLDIFFKNAEKKDEINLKAD